MEPLPNFLLVGAMKCGTTSLHAALDRLPDVGFTRDKEPGFLADADLDRAALVAAYADAYPRLPTWRGDASTDYAKVPQVPDVPARAVDLLGEVPILYLVRDPIDRIRSHWRHLVVTGRTSDPLERAVVDNPRLVDTTRYATQVDAWREFLPRERILVLHLHELTTDAGGTLERVVRHIGLDGVPEVPAELPRENVQANQLRGGTVTDRIARSAFYRRHVRDRIPKDLRRRVPTLLGQRGAASMPDEALDPATERDLRAELEPELERLRDQYGLRHAG